MISLPVAEISAVVFDVGGVFVLPHPDRVRPALVTIGATPPRHDEPLRRAHYEGALAYDRSPDAPETWPAYLRGYLTALGLDPTEDEVEEFRLAWAGRSIDLWSWLQPPAAQALRALASAGVALAVVSNADGTVEASLARLGVCQVGPGPGVEVAAIVDSAVVGFQKPDPRTFAPALEALSVPAERCLYVGDTVRNDVVGARAAGLHPVHLDPYGLTPPADHDIVASLDEVVSHLVEHEH